MITDSERWKQIKDIAGAAMELDGDKRSSYLAKACPSDDDHRREVQRLLDEHDQVGDFLEEPVLTPHTSHEPASSTPTSNLSVIPKGPTPTMAEGLEDQLPPDLIERIANRLSAMGLFYAITYVITYLSMEMVAHVIGNNLYIQSIHTPGQLVALTFVSISVVVFLVARRAGLGATSLINLGLSFEVVGAFGIALSMNMVWPPLEESTWIWGVSWICVWIIAFPIFVPSPPKKAAIAAFLSAAMGPLSLWFWVVTAPMEWPSMENVLRMSIPNFVCAAAAWWAASTVFGLGVDLGRAKKLGSYQLDSLLGRGGMGEVWIARHHMLARPAALKLVRPEVLVGRDGKSALRRFQMEARTTAALTSPHTINLYDFGVTDEGVFYYAMELLDGFDLETLVRRFGPVPPERAIHFLQQCCGSLAEAHEHFLVHRDVKPANVFACRQGRDHDFVKVLDFGLVVTKTHPEGATRVTGDMHVVGTPGYMAPELALGAEPDARADLYSLGCVGYWLVTGQTVFEDGPSLQVVTSHIHTPPSPPSERAPQKIPKELDEVLLWCLEKDPTQRTSRRRPACRASEPRTDRRHVDGHPRTAMVDG